jgi:hypothetical protein
VSENQTVTVNRTLVGVLAIACLIGAAAAFLYEDDDVNMWRGIFTRVGLVLTALWMALPKEGTLGKWANVSLTTLIGITLAIFMVARNPRQYVPLMLAVAAVGRFLRPREKARPAREFRERKSDQAQ